MLVAALLLLILCQAQGLLSPRPAHTKKSLRRLSLASSPLDRAVQSYSSLLSAITAEDLAGYEKEGVPPWVVVLSLSMVAVTALIPVVVRKKQVERNSRRPTPDMVSRLENVEDDE